MPGLPSAEQMDHGDPWTSSIKIAAVSHPLNCIVSVSKKRYISNAVSMEPFSTSVFKVLV